MVTRAFHPQITEVFILFHDHQTAPQATANMNNVYAFGIPLADLLLPDGSNWRDSATVIDDILALIITNVDSEAVHTADKTRIPPLIKSCSLKFDDPNTPALKPIRNPGALENAFRTLERQHRQNNNLTFNLFVNFSNWFIDLRQHCNTQNS